MVISFWFTDFNLRVQSWKDESGQSNWSWGGAETSQRWAEVRTQGVLKHVPVSVKASGRGEVCIARGCGVGLRTSSLPGELLKAVDAEAVAALSLDRLPQHLETLLTFVFILHGHRQHAEGNSWQRWGAVQWNSSHSPPSICCEFLWRYNEC